MSWHYHQGVASSDKQVNNSNILGQTILSFEDDGSLQRACITHLLHDVLWGHIHTNMTVQNIKCNMNGCTKNQQIQHK